ncbi:hypothetical protein SSP531S_15250 [Streptomyces spongiicola]|uniref:Uncharacterized protein n=1 Tax=Streptomyces spongiicola TaxID=1690221 RepID=A0A388SYS3_9ACTN|nr:hypothetical protein SSP531S_15250 [Streptomyces spongiicola]
MPPAAPTGDPGPCRSEARLPRGRRRSLPTPCRPPAGAGQGSEACPGRQAALPGDRGAGPCRAAPGEGAPGHPEKAHPGTRKRRTRHREKAHPGTDTMQFH